MISNWLSSIEKKISAEKIDRHNETIQKIADLLIREHQAGNKAQLNFICTHNSRRSQFAQTWCRVVQDYLGIYVADSYSGGTEVTACNERTVAALRRAGLLIERKGKENPVYSVKAHDVNTHLKLWSKVYDDEANPGKNFAAIMTCDHADANCPFIPGADARISLTYTDPKYADDTEEESEAYDTTCEIIATDMMRIFTEVKSRI
ncbi:MAG: protein-tyrosine-phosphatase [Balneolaceae bacterium]|nr:protein-tyrosine-phosphatase [Balneolaceae bacterium]